jgi:hypothetical protein
VRQCGRCLAWAAAALFLLLHPVGKAHAQETRQSLAEQAVDPTAALMSFQLVDNYSASLWQQDGTSNQLLFRGAVPFRAWRTSHILRVTVPYTTGGVRGAGSEPVQIFDLIVFQQKWGRWGLGPLLSLGQDGGPDGAGPFAFGPALGIVIQRGRWTLGVLNQNLFGRNIAISQLQPIIAYQLGDGWALSAGDSQYPYDWHAGSFTTVPLSLQLSKVLKLAGQPVRLFVNPQYNLLDKPGADQWKFGSGFAVLVPAGGGAK